MHNRRAYIVLVSLAIFAGTFCLSPAISLFIDDVIIRSSGQISPVLTITATTGSASDIQAAVDWIVARGGVGIVQIPEGTFNFVEVGEPWTTVQVPSGINITGAPTLMDSSGQVIEWKTVLVMPYEVPAPDKGNLPEWFSIYLNGDKPFRFSDIKLIGWRYFDYLQNGEPDWTIPYDPNNPGDRGSETMYVGVHIYDSPYNTPYDTSGIHNFRVDHSCFQDLAGSGVIVAPGETIYNRHVICGVIHHNRFVNSYGDPGRLGTSDYEYRTLDYGIRLRRWASDLWDPNLGNIAGHYLDYTVFIEDNYFSKWRHDVCVNDGLHIVVRHNVFDMDYAVGSVDAHGSYAVDTRPYAVGSRLMEIYSNTFKNPAIGIWDPKAWCINVRGGAALIYNNTVLGHTYLVGLNEEDGNVNYQNKCKIDQVYIWNNSLGGADIIGYDDRRLGGSYYLRAPTLEQDGFEYAPYQYPHPLT